jgi:tRNA A37 methylthiotransferase MiaB
MHNETVLLAMADCQAKTDESAEIIILGCTAETRQPQAVEAIQSYMAYNSF